MSESFFYFAYGSNLWPARLQARCPSAEAVAVGLLRGHVLRFHKLGRDGSAKCDAFPTGDPGDAVPGALYALAAADRPALDAAEDLGEGYAAWDVQIELAQDTRTEWALTYVAYPDMTREGIAPFHWYRELVLAGARHHGLQAEHLAALGCTAYAPDPDPDRAALHQELLTRGQGG